MGMIRHSQSSQNSKLQCLYNISKKKLGMELKINSSTSWVVFDDSSQTCPKYPKKNFVKFLQYIKSMLTWDPKRNQTNLRFHFGVLFHFGERQLPYQHSYDFRQSETHFGANFTWANLTEVKFHTTVTFPCKQWMSALK